MNLTCEDVQDLEELLSLFASLAWDAPSASQRRRWEEAQPLYEKWFKRLFMGMQPGGEANCACTETETE